MKKMNKRGFTIVELVIVIAVIAILAAVLIPTFANLVKKANLSADQQAVRQMNTILTTEGALGNGSSVYEAKAVLEKNGLNPDDYKALTDGYAFYYDVENVCVVLVNAEGKIEYPADYEDVAIGVNHVLLASGAGSMSTVEKVSTADALLSAIENKANATTMITLTDNVELSSENVASINTALANGATVNLDLGGNTLTTAAGFDVKAGASLYVENGTMNTTYASSNGYARTANVNGGTLHLNGVKGVVTNNSEEAEWAVTVFAAENATILIENSDLTAHTYVVSTNGSVTKNPYIEIVNSILTTTDDFGATVLCNVAGAVKITDSTINGAGMGVFMRVGAATITNTTINKTMYESNGTTDVKDSTGAKVWGSGTYVPNYAAIVVGDGLDASYPGSASVVLNGCTLTTSNNGETVEAVTVYTSSDANTTASFSHKNCTGVVAAEID